MGGKKPAQPAERRKSLREVKTTFNQIVETAGLQDYDRRVLLTLVFDGRLDAAALAQKADVPQGKVYEVLSRLSEKGLVFCQDEAARPKIFVAARPEVIVDMLTRHWHEIKTSAERIEPELTELYENALAAGKPEDLGSYFASHTTPAGIASELFASVRGARSILSVGRDFSWLTDVPRLKDIVGALARGGGTVRLLSSEAAPSSALQLLAANTQESGVEIRWGSHLRGRYLILDERSILIGVRKRSPRASEPAYSMVRVENEELAADLTALFTSAWMDAKSAGGA